MTQKTDARRRIVVGVDASQASEAALRWAIGYARAVGAEVVAVHAFEAPVYFSYPSIETAPILVDQLFREGVRRRFEEDWCAPLAEAGLPYRETAELVVTGRRGLNTLGELVLGSVSHHLVHGSKCPVVVVPGGEQTA